MLYTRRDLGRIALATGFISGSTARLMGTAKPNSLIKGVQIGVITYSYRSMPDQSAEATLKYCIDSGISAIELMGDPVNDWARKKGKWDSSPAAAAAAAAAESMRAAGRGGPGARPQGTPSRRPPSYAPVAGMKTGWGNDQPAGQWNGQACPERRPPAPPKPAAGRPPRREPTPEQKAAREAERKWRLGLSMDIFKELRKLYNDAGVSIYAVKDVRQETDEDLEYTFTVARTLGASHVTLELPSGPNAAATLKRLGDAALKYKMFVAYHTHEQGSMTAFDEAFSLSKGNMANIDFGHFIANPNAGGTPMDFLKKFHSRISSCHIKDRTTVEHCALNLPWGYGETPIKEILELISKNRWQIPATIELEYAIPPDSDAVKEVARCLEYCRKVL